MLEPHDELIPYYENGREIVTYSGFDDLLERIRWLLREPDQAGRERTAREHTWEMRFDRVLQMPGVLA
jgi:spore maturation protein CgeB